MSGRLAMAKLAPLVLGAAAVLGAGLWLGRASTPAPRPAAPPGAASEAAPAAPAAGTPAPRPAAIPTPARAAPQLPAHRTDPGLSADLSDPDPKVRRAAVRELARGADPDPALLLTASRDGDLQVGVTATEALGKLHGRGQVPVGELIARATDRRLDERVRVSALNGLGLVPSPEAAQLLTELASRGDVGERRTAAILLTHQDAQLAVPPLIALLGDADEYVRGNALEALRARSRGRDFGADAAAWRAWWASRSR